MNNQLIISSDTVLFVKRFQKEKENIFKQIKCDIFHIGSTSIRGLITRPSIDILLAINQTTEIEDKLINIGYIKEDEYFSKKDEFSFHVYVEASKDKLLINDYLIRHDFYIKQFNEIKMNFINSFDEDKYEKAKKEFYDKILKLIALEKTHKKGRLSRLIDGEDIRSYSNQSVSNDGLSICDKNIDGA